MTDREQELLAALKWADQQLSALVTEDDGNGTFIRGTGTELVGFCIGRDQMRAAIASADASASRAVSPDQQAAIVDDAAERFSAIASMVRSGNSPESIIDFAVASADRMLAALSPQEPR